MTITAESLGLTREEILERVVQQIVTTLLEQSELDEDGVAVPTRSRFATVLRRKVLERADAAVADIAGRHVLPNVASYVETLCLQETNKWGEKTGKSMTFIEYLVERADRYLREEVDYEGKAKDDDRYHSNWRKAGTRISYLVDKHLQYSIETAMKQALATANAAIVGGITDAVKIKLAEVLASLKVETKVGR
jgi:hypothetical protein